MEGHEQDKVKQHQATTIISFIGTTPNIGTTVVALRHGFHIAQFTTCKVLFLCFNFKSSKLQHYFNVDQKCSTLDDILPSLKSKRLTINSLLKMLYQPSKQYELFLLFGNRQREIAEQFFTEDLTELLELARPHFDYIVIDANSYWDNAGSFVAIQSAHHIIVTTTDARSHFQEDFHKWFGSLAPHLSLQHEQLYLLLIRQHYSEHHYSYKDIVAETNTSPYLDCQFPLSMYSYLDRGELLEWLIHDTEAKQWLAESCHFFINPIHLSLLPPIPETETKLYWPWQKRHKVKPVVKVGDIG